MWILTKINPPRNKRRKPKMIPQMKNPAQKSLKVNPRRKKLSPSQKEQKINPWPRNPHLKSRHLRRNPLRNPLPKSQQLRNQSMSKILTVNLRKNLPWKSLLKKRVRRKLSLNMFLKKENVELHLPEVPFRPKKSKVAKKPPVTAKKSSPKKKPVAKKSSPKKPAAKKAGGAKKKGKSRK